jgi:NAD-dependent dihydropyrimidine dehydrogenase PreA subunit
MSKQTNSKGYHPPEIVDDSYCVDCGLCALLCPDFAIYVQDAGTRAPDKIVPIHREAPPRTGA